MSSDNRYGRSLIVCSLAQLHELNSLSPIIRTAARFTRDHLVILLFSQHFNDYRHWHQVQKIVTWIYVQATTVAQDMDKVLLDVDVILRGSRERNGYDLKEHEFDSVHKFEDELPEHVCQLPESRGSDGKLNSNLASNENDPSFPVVALGGTFDHLHAGHKVLLSMSAWIATQKVIVGVTDDALLVNKSNKHLLQSIDERISRVRSFLTNFKPGLELEIVPIHDVYGPTGWDPNIQALVVSKETLPGATSIDKLRKEKGLPQLQTFVIDVISATEILEASDTEHLKKAKISSTYIREWIAKNLK